jgi:hypothetical protein
MSQDRGSIATALVASVEPFQLTPLYEDIPWELLLPARKRTQAMINRLCASARRAVF